MTIRARINTLIKTAFYLPFFVLLSLLASFAAAQERPPAAPLVVFDPYFSIWSISDKLTDSTTRHWTGAEQPLAGLVRIDGVDYRYMGANPEQVPAMPQVGLHVDALHTDYSFEQSGVALTVSFFTAALPHDMDALAQPVTYLSWAVHSTDGRAHSVKVLLDVSPRVAVNSDDQDVTWGRFKAAGLDVLSAGSRDQRVLNRAGDNLRIDWGYVYLAVPQQDGAAVVASSNAVGEFLKAGELPTADEMEMPREPRNGAAHLAVALTMNASGPQVVSKHVLLAYNEVYPIEYLQRKLRPYWQRDGQTPGAMLAVAEQQYGNFEAKGRHFDADLAADLEKVGGKAYAQLGALAYRQTLAAHGFAVDVDGTAMLFPKENFSNGCISTVDILYPSAPFFLFFNPALLEAQLKPVLEYSALARWKWPFAPHDLGTYPMANGQVYGGGERTEEDQMPVEESGNMLILMDALGRAQGSWHLSEEYWPQLTKWADYLRSKGLDPENQLSTDDFAGHLVHNANLSIKAIEGIAAYSHIARQLGKREIADQYAAAAKQMAAQWEGMAKDGDHYKLAFDKPGTWSQKYNLVWDQLLDFNLFPASVRQTEVKFYLEHLNKYGLPLDSRADYTKLDWQIWTATLTSDPKEFQSLIAPIGQWINAGPTRVPLTDWYDTKTGKMIAFQARSVVGGIFIKALADKATAKKWAEYKP